MARVLCELPNASGQINGVAFARAEIGMLSEAVSDEVAAEFASIAGYSIVAVAPPGALPPAEPPPAAPIPAPPPPHDAEGGATAAQHTTPRQTRRRA